MTVSVPYEMYCSAYGYSLRGAAYLCHTALGSDDKYLGGSHPFHNQKSLSVSPMKLI